MAREEEEILSAVSENGPDNSMASQIPKPPAKGGNGRARRAGRVPFAILLAAAALALLWSLDHFLLHIKILTPYQGQAPLSPLYAFWVPAIRPEAVIFILLAAGLVGVVPVLTDPQRMSRRLFTLALVLLALALPLALFMVRQDIRELGSQFRIYPGEEYYEDAIRIRNLPGFIRGYVEWVPKLSSHGRTHPPGNAALLYLVGKALGSSTFAAGLGVLLFFAAGIAVTYEWLRVVVGEHGARMGAILVLASPSVLDFGCTSLDAVFLLAAGLAVWPGLVAFSGRGGPAHAIAAGAALFGAMMFSFLAFPVGLFLLLYGLARAWYSRRTRRPASALMHLGLMLAAFLASSLIVELVTGFNLWDCFLVARREHVTQMTKFIGRPLREVYWPATYGNTSALLIGVGLAIVPLFALRLAEVIRKRRLDPFLLAVLLTGGAMCAGGLFAMETERIWLFAIPWVAAGAVGSDPLPQARDVRWLVGAGWFQTLAMEIVLFTLW
jgi:hypothetical protein